MVPQRGDDGNRAVVQGFEKHLYFLKMAVVGEVSPDHEHIGLSRSVAGKSSETLGIFYAPCVDIGGSRDLQDRATLAVRPGTAASLCWPQARRVGPTLSRPP